MLGRSPSFLIVAVLAACTDVTQPAGDSTSIALAKAGSGIVTTLLPSLGGAFSEARAINDEGVVVGFSADNTGSSFAVRWTRTPGGTWSVAPIAGPDSRALAVSENGAAVGVRAGRAKLWPAAGGEIDLGAGEPNGINSAETVVGVSRDPLPEHAVVWRKPVTGWDLVAENRSQELPAFAGGTGETVAKAINDAGVITGASGVSTGISSYYAVRWDPEGDQWALPVALPGTDSNSSTSGRAINDNAQPDIGGHVRRCGQCGAFGIFWSGGNSGTSLEPFGGGPGFVAGINDARRVVGFRETRSGRRGFVWSWGRTSVQELGGTRGYSATWAYDINNLNPAQAVGFGQGMSVSAAILWTIP